MIRAWSLGALILAVGAGCKDASKANDKRAPVEGGTAPMADGGSAPAAAISEIRLVGTTLSIGAPRFRVGPRHAAIAVSLQQGFAAAATSDGVGVWATSDGLPVARWTEPWRQRSRLYGPLALASGKPLLATSRNGAEEVLHLPDGAVVGRPADAVESFANSGHVVTSSLLGIRTFDLASASMSARYQVPAGTASLTLAAVEHGGLIDWLRQDGGFECDPKSGTVTQRLAGHFDAGALAAEARTAVVNHDGNAYKVDLATGKETMLVPHAGMSVVSPDGLHFASAVDGGVVTIDGSTSSVQTTVKVNGNVTALAWTDRNNVLAYVVDGVLVLYDLNTGARKVDQPARFVGWLAEGSAAVERGGVVEAVDVRSGSVTPAAPAAVAKLRPHAPKGAPAWATWLEVMPSGALVAAEPSVQHERPISQRGECESSLRVWTASGGVQTLSTPPSDGSFETTLDPCWHIDGGWVIGASTQTLQVFDPVTGKRVVELAAPSPEVHIPRSLYASRFYEVIASPDGKLLGLVWRRPDVFASDSSLSPEEARERMASVVEHDCHRTSEGACVMEEFAEVWQLSPGATKRLWQSRLPLFEQPFASWEAKPASGAIAFTHDGKYALFGYDDGDIVIHAVADGAMVRTEHQHPVSVTRIEVSPGDDFVFSEDIEGEQRIWPLR